MLLKLMDGTEKEIDDQMFKVIENNILQTEHIGDWVTYGMIFSNIKPAVQAELGAAVWHIAGVLDHLANEGKYVTFKLDENNEKSYKVNKGE